MPEPTGVARSLSPEERRYRRFKLRYPVHLLFRSGELISEVDTLSRDVSVGGLLVESPVLIPQNAAVNFVISLRGRTLRPVELMGEGRVVRVEHAKAAEFAVAIECKNPISQIDTHVPAETS